MNRQCHCGQELDLNLRTVIYFGKVEINNVPIYTCDSCNKSEVIPEVKSDLTSLIHKLGNQPEKQNYLFNECNEWANLLVKYKVTNEHKFDVTHSLQSLAEERKNELLDLFLLAQSLNDLEWMNSIEKKLQQISVSAFDM